MKTSVVRKKVEINHEGLRKVTGREVLVVLHRILCFKVLTKKSRISRSKKNRIGNERRSEVVVCILGSLV